MTVHWDQCRLSSHLKSLVLLAISIDSSMESQYIVFSSCSKEKITTYKFHFISYFDDIQLQLVLVCFIEHSWYFLNCLEAISAIMVLETNKQGSYHTTILSKVQA